MTTNLHAITPFGSAWSTNSKYIIDFERGLVTHSKTLTKGQFNRWMGEGPSARRPDLNPRQAFQYYTKYLVGEKFLLFLKHAHNTEVDKLLFQSSFSYALNHIDFFEKLDNQLAYPVVQLPNSGFVRTKIERDNVVKYLEKYVHKALHYGMIRGQIRTDKQVAERTYQSLRNIAFKQSEPAVEAVSESNEQ